MANTKSAAKRARQTNQAHRSATARVLTALKSKTKAAAHRDAVRQGGEPDGQLVSDLDKAVKRGVIHKNAANRRKSRLAKKLAAPAPRKRLPKQGRDGSPSQSLFLDWKRGFDRSFPENLGTGSESHPYLADDRQPSGCLFYFPPASSKRPLIARAFVQRLVHRRGQHAKVPHLAPGLALALP